MTMMAIVYFISLPSGTLVIHMGNLEMIESLKLFKVLITDNVTKLKEKKYQMLLRFTFTLVSLLPMMLGRLY